MLANIQAALKWRPFHEVAFQVSIRAVVAVVAGVAVGLITNLALKSLGLAVIVLPVFAIPVSSSAIGTLIGFGLSVGAANRMLKRPLLPFTQLTSTCT